jgi:hypothetical protein
MATRYLIGTIALTVTLGCGGGSNTAQSGQPAATGQQSAGQQQVAQGAQATKQGAEQAAQGLQQVAQGFQTMAQGAAKPVDFEQLKAFAPEVGGWTRSNLKGQQMNMPFAMSNAEANYAKGESSIELQITDSALNQLIFAPFTMFLAAGYDERSDDGYKKAIKVGGQPGFESWEKGNKQGEITVVVANRFLIVATGRDVESVEPVRKLVEAIDLAKMAALK